MRRKADQYTIPEPHTTEYILQAFLELTWHNIPGVKKGYKEFGVIRYEFPYDCSLGGEACERFGRYIQEANIGNEFHITVNKDKFVFVFTLKRSYDLNDIKTTIIKHRMARKQLIGDMEFVTYG